MNSMVNRTETLQTTNGEKVHYVYLLEAIQTKNKSMNFMVAMFQNLSKHRSQVVLHPQVSTTLLLPEQDTTLADIEYCRVLYSYPRACWEVLREYCFSHVRSYFSCLWGRKRRGKVRHETSMPSYDTRVKWRIRHMLSPQIGQSSQYFIRRNQRIRRVVK